MSDDALRRLADELRRDEVLGAYVTEPREASVLGALAATGPRAAEAPGEYTLLVEAIREGYLLHYDEPRLVDGADPDLRLLTGDYLYALGLERLAARGDLPAVRELADLISLCAQLHAEHAIEGGSSLTGALWLASAVAVGAGASEEHERAKEAVRRGDGASDALLAAARDAAERAGMADALAHAGDSIGLAIQDSSDGG
jgi:hypothetical protein